MQTKDRESTAILLVSGWRPAALSHVGIAAAFNRCDAPVMRWAIWIGLALLVGIALLILSLLICLNCQLG